MSTYVDLDVRGLSCPEPVMLTMETIDANPGKTIRVIANEAHTKTNIEKMLKYQGKDFAMQEKDSDYEITFTA